MCLQALAITDFKKPVAFASRLRYVRGQALSEFILTSLAAGHDVPTMATDLGFNTRIYHSEGEGTDRHVKELVFHNVGQALTYFGAVVDQVQKHIAPALKREELFQPSPLTVSSWFETRQVSLLFCPFLILF
jgi:hypothetical protein